VPAHVDADAADGAAAAAGSTGRVGALHRRWPGPMAPPSPWRRPRALSRR
jgi:hypothetical protein